MYFVLLLLVLLINSLREVIEANKTDTKNIIPKSLPNGINLNTDGIVINNSGGPDAGSKLNAKTAGIITNPAKNAPKVSNITVFFALDIISTSLFR